MSTHHEEVHEAAREWVAAQAGERSWMVRHVSDGEIKQIVDDHYPTGFDGFHEDYVAGGGVG